MSIHKIINRCSKLLQPIVSLKKDVQITDFENLSKSQRLMLDVGLIKQSSTGNFHYLPLAMKSFEKLIKIVEDELKYIDAQKVDMPALTKTTLWKKSGRLNTVDNEIFKLKDRHDIDYILSPTHEESAADLLASLAPLSYKQFPLRIYQITNKFRDEMKPRFGLIRSRQFYMKDLYSFDVDLKAAQTTYEAVCNIYNQIFNQIGIKYVKVVGSTGNIGGTVSHEYHFPSEVGEDKLLFCSNCHFHSNMELVDNEKCPNCKDANKIEIKNGIEVGHTFLLGEKYSKPLKATFLSLNAKPSLLQMGSYGLGLSRILAGAIEVLSTEQEIRWPINIAPYKILIISPKDGSVESKSAEHLSEEIYFKLNSLDKFQNEVLLDDRNNFTIGRRLIDAKRTGYPFIIVIGNKILNNPPLLEVIDLNNDKILYLNDEQLYDFFKLNS